MERVRISTGKFNYLKDDGSYFLDEHAYHCCDFSDGFGVVRYNYDIENFVNTEGKQLLKTNVHHCLSFHKGFAEIRINDNWYKIDTESNFYSYKDKVSFKDLYNEYNNMRSELIEIIEKYTYYDVNEYFNI